MLTKHFLTKSAKNSIFNIPSRVYRILHHGIPEKQCFLERSAPNLFWTQGSAGKSRVAHPIDIFPKRSTFSGILGKVGHLSLTATIWAVPFSNESGWEKRGPGTEVFYSRKLLPTFRPILWWASLIFTVFSPNLPFSGGLGDSSCE